MVMTEFRFHQDPIEGSAVIWYIKSLPVRQLSWLMTMNPNANSDEPLGKIVGRRRKEAAALSLETSNRRQSQAWRAAFGGIPIAKGVYRFHTHEEADEWLWKMITRPRKD
jgi:hypothetical protein